MQSALSRKPMSIPNRPAYTSAFPMMQQQLAAVDLRAQRLAQLSYTPNQIVSPVPVGSDVAAGTARLVANALGMPVPKQVQFPLGDATYTLLPLASSVAPSRTARFPSTISALAAGQPGTALTAATASVLRATTSGTPGVVVVQQQSQPSSAQAR